MASGPSALLLQMLRRADAWLNSAPDEVPSDARSADKALASSALALLTSQAASQLGLAPGPDWTERAAAFDARAHTPSEQGVLARYQRAVALKAALGLDAPVPPPSPEELALRAQLDALQKRQVDLAAHTTPGNVQAAALDGLDALLGEYRALRAAAPPDSSALPHLCDFAASAAFSLGRGRSLAGELKKASAAYAQASDLYTAAGEPDQAQAAALEAARTRFAADADVDGASLADLARIADGIVDPVERARARMRLSDRAGDANHAFAALGHAEAALASLAEAGFPQPPPGQLDAVAAAWVRSATGHAQGEGVVRLLCEVATILSRTMALRWRTTPAAYTAAAQADADALDALARAVLAESAAVQAQVRTGLAAYGLQTEAPAVPPPSRTGQATELLRRLGDATTPAEADALVAEARTLEMPALVAQACVTQAIVRLDADNVQGCIDASLDGEAALLLGAASAETLIGLPAFDILVELRRQRLGALSTLKETQGVFDCAWSTVRAIEAARYRISDPLQQAAFLSQRTAFYELAAFSAFKLQRWDDLLTAMDLFKARSAIRNRLAPAPDADTATLSSRLQAATQALATAPPDRQAVLAADRQALWSLLTVARLSKARAADLPVLSVAAVQAVLAPEEAAVSWSFIAPGVLLVLALTAKDLHSERIILDGDQQTLLSQYIAAIEATHVNNRALGRTVSQLTAMLLPADTLAFIAAAKRLILSPHRQLNLVPLHAGRIGDLYLIERASVRYVPNLASLLIPWTGSGRGVAAVGLNQSDMANCPPLVNAESEAQAVADAWAAQGAPTRRLLGGQVTMAGVAAFDWGSARCIHIATHGSTVFLGAALANPFLSHLVLKDGFLDALSISELALQAEVVVTGACFSGQRALSVEGLTELPGDDMFGLQSAFFQAGAGSVVGALWMLNDEAASRMLPALQAGLAGGAPADLALQAALKAELSRYTAGDIYGWAPLFLSSMGRATLN